MYRVMTLPIRTARKFSCTSSSACLSDRASEHEAVSHVVSRILFATATRHKREALGGMGGGRRCACAPDGVQHVDEPQQADHAKTELDIEAGAASRGYPVKRHGLDKVLRNERRKGLEEGSDKHAFA